MSIRNHLSESVLLAAWITPKGRVLDIGRSSHISFVMDNPRKFGLTDDDVKSCGRVQDVKSIGKKDITTYTDGMEDKDWDCIINKVLKNSFVRIRRVKINKYSYMWYMDVYEFNGRTRKTLSDMAFSMDKNKDDRVIISVSRGSKPNNITNMSDLSKIVEEHDPLQFISLNEMEEI